MYFKNLYFFLNESLFLHDTIQQNKFQVDRNLNEKTTIILVEENIGKYLCDCKEELSEHSSAI